MKWHILLYGLKETNSELKAVLVSGDVYANGGANDVQEVAMRGDSGLLRAINCYFNVTSIFTCTNSSVYILLGCKLLHEIAGRALRVLWARISGSVRCRRS